MREVDMSKKCNKQVDPPDESFARVRFRTRKRCQTGHQLSLACSSRLPTLVILAFPGTHVRTTRGEERNQKREDV